MSDEYNGWTNRETWALNLHLSNDEGLYSYTLEHVDGETSAMRAGESIVAMVEMLRDEMPDSEGIRNMMSDVGSLWRVDAAELGAAWLAEVSS